MKKRILAGLTASVLAAACAAQIPSILSASAAGSYDMQLKIQLDGEKKEISPYIYGVNESKTSFGKLLRYSRFQTDRSQQTVPWEYHKLPTKGS